MAMETSSDTIERLLKMIEEEQAQERKDKKTKSLAKASLGGGTEEEEKAFAEAIRTEEEPEEFMGPLEEASFAGPPEQEKSVRTVKSGDTLGDIAKDLYGSVNEWKRLAEENPHLSPHKILPGQKVYYRPQGPELSVTEESIQKYKPGKEPATSSTEEEALYEIVSDVETGAPRYKNNRWIRTEVIPPSGSSAWGPLQVTRDYVRGKKKEDGTIVGGLVNDKKYMDMLSTEEKDYLKRFIKQGDLFLRYGNEPKTDFPKEEWGLWAKHQYGFEGTGTLTSKKDKDLYKAVFGKALAHGMSTREMTAESLSDYWHGVDPKDTAEDKEEKLAKYRKGLKARGIDKIRAKEEWTSSGLPPLEEWF